MISYNMDKGVFRSGTSGLVLSEPNKLSFPAEFQDKHRLIYYASKFNSIEINSSFYKIPLCRTYKNWAEIVPEDFQFTIKLWQGITHEERFDQNDLIRFFCSIQCLGNKKGCLLIQFPAKAKIDFSGFDHLLENIRKMDPQEDWRLAVEFRHTQWYESEIYEILDEYHAGMVLHDMPKCIPPDLNKNADFVYLRFHGEKGDYRGSYSDQYLTNKAKEIRLWLDQGKDVYAYFNNTIGDAVANLQTLKTLVEKS
ncbi:MAG TPA: DUF72 domain-containing protein [Puia sp.]|nr:DUF72 domain-containing protein [Puia sp.]